MAREVASTLKWMNQVEHRFEFVGYIVSDLSRMGDRDSRDQVVGDFNWLDQHRNSVDAVAVGVGSPSVRLRLARELSSLLNGISWPALMHPTAIVDIESASLGEGCFIGAGVVATVNVVLEPFALCNFGCSSRRPRFRGQSRGEYFGRRGYRRRCAGRYGSTGLAIPSHRFWRCCWSRSGSYAQCPRANHCSGHPSPRPECRIVHRSRQISLHQYQI